MTIIPKKTMTCYMATVCNMNSIDAKLIYEVCLVYQLKNWLKRVK